MTWSREGNRAKSTLKFDTTTKVVVPKSDVISKQHRADKVAEERAPRTVEDWKQVVFKRAGELAVAQWDTPYWSGFLPLPDIRKNIITVLQNCYPDGKNNYLFEAIRSVDWNGHEDIRKQVEHDLEYTYDLVGDGVKYRRVVAGHMLNYAVEWFTANGYPVVTNYRDDYSGKTYKKVILSKA